LEWGILCSILAAMGYIGGVLFNNSYLPEIASVEQQDRVSAKGFAYGYVGSVILQVICFLFVLKPDWFGITDASLPARLSFLLVGIWWITFAQIPFKYLPETPKTANKLSRRVVKQGFVALAKVWNRVKKMPSLKGFLGAFFFYAMVVQTILLVGVELV